MNLLTEIITLVKNFACKTDSLKLFVILAIARLTAGNMFLDWCLEVEGRLVDARRWDAAKKIF